MIQILMPRPLRQAMLQAGPTPSQLLWHAKDRKVFSRNPHSFPPQHQNSSWEATARVAGVAKRHYQAVPPRPQEPDQRLASPP
mmetsp:Transcript_19479/g.54203  ORF Transcript_19479/g.54203 Transcript_19479/m.54203 type:complete len:83 (+) Transcript_19479:251-499(+)